MIRYKATIVFDYHTEEEPYSARLSSAFGGQPPKTDQEMAERLLMMDAKQQAFGFSLIRNRLEGLHNDIEMRIIQEIDERIGTNHNLIDARTSYKITSFERLEE